MLHEGEKGFHVLKYLERRPIDFRSFTQRHAENQISAEKLFNPRKRILIKNCIFRSCAVLWSFSSRRAPVSFHREYLSECIFVWSRVVVIATTREDRFLGFALFTLHIGTLYTYTYRMQRTSIHSSNQASHTLRATVQMISSSSSICDKNTCALHTHTHPDSIFGLCLNYSFKWCSRCCCCHRNCRCRCFRFGRKI